MKFSTLIDGYLLGPLLGRGTQGEVYEATEVSTGQKVALKLLHGGRWSDTEIRTCTMLEHPNIVPILRLGEHEGLPYIVMKLLKGSLAAESPGEGRLADPKAAARLMAKVAGAVHYLHQAGVLHRDLKSANILVDEAGEPYVADFGVAKFMDESEHGTIAGTRPYMAPEQLDGRTTVRSDIYSLGVILYELLAGRRPFQSARVSDLNREIREASPRELRKLRPGLDVELSRICLRCLEKAPADRYGSAEALSTSLVRYLNGELPEGASWYRRLWRWCLRHVVAAGFVAALTTFLMIIIPTVVSLAQEHEQTKRARLTQVNTNNAAMVAGTVLSHLRALGEAVELSARDPMLAAAVQSGDRQLQQVRLEAFYDGGNDPARGLGSPFDTWFVLDNEGRLTAQFGKASATQIIGRDYAWRDYFRARELATKGRRSIYVSRVFKSELDAHYKFALSTPIYGRAGEPVGVLVAAVATSAKLGSLGFDDPENIRALVGPRDRERSGPPEAPYMILLHPGYAYGEADPLTSEPVRVLEEASRALRIEQPLGLPPPSLVAAGDDYRDPVGERDYRYAGQWIAGFAPVGNTGLVIVVQTPDDVLHSEVRFSRRLMIWACVSAIPGVLLMSLAVLHRRRRRLGPSPGAGGRGGR